MNYLKQSWWFLWSTYGFSLCERASNVAIVPVLQPKKACEIVLTAYSMAGPYEKKISFHDKSHLSYPKNDIYNDDIVQFLSI